MTQNGRAGAALAIAAIGSFVAGTLGVLGLIAYSSFRRLVATLGSRYRLG